MTRDELALIADVLAWTGGYACMCDDALIGAEKRDDIYAAARECAADLERECEDRNG